MDKTLFRNLINTIKDGSWQSLILEAEGLEAVAYDRNLYATSYWQGGLKAGLPPFILKEASRERKNILLRGYAPTSSEAEAIAGYLSSLNPNEAEISYLAVARSRTTPQPLSHWDDMSEAHLPPHAVSQRTQVLAYVATEVESLAPKAALVLDVGCGDGRLLELLSDKGFRLWGLDANKACVKQAKEALEDKAAVIMGDAADLPRIMPQKGFDLAVAVGLLDSQVVSRKDGERILAAIAAVLREGGTLVCANYTMPAIPPTTIGQYGFTIYKKTAPQHFYNNREPKEIIVARKQH